MGVSKAVSIQISFILSKYTVNRHLLPGRTAFAILVPKYRFAGQFVEQYFVLKIISRMKTLQNEKTGHFYFQMAMRCQILR